VIISLGSLEPFGVTRTVTTRSIARRRRTGLSRRLAHADVEDVTSSDDQTAEVCCGVSAAEFSSSVEDNVHVAVAVDHLSPVFCVVLQFYRYVTVEFPH
jgi:hypothetical protein